MTSHKDESIMQFCFRSGKDYATVKIFLERMTDTDLWRSLALAYVISPIVISSNDNLWSKSSITCDDKFPSRGFYVWQFEQVSIIAENESN